MPWGDFELWSFWSFGVAQSIITYPPHTISSSSLYTPTCSCLLRYSPHLILLKERRYLVNASRALFHTLLLATMNTRPAIESSSRPLALSASFNQDASCFTVGLETGFCSTHPLACAAPERLRAYDSLPQYSIRSRVSSALREVRFRSPLLKKAVY
jgi:hypothetical protein